MANFPITQVSGRLPEELDAAMAVVLKSQIGPSFDEARVLEVRNSVRAGAVPNYDVDWAAFNYLYFSANFLKSYLAARVSSICLAPRPLTILDLGCGAGASTAGFIFGLQSLGHRVSRVVALDTNRSQLHAFRSATALWIQSWNSAIRVDVFESDMQVFMKTREEDFDVVLLSYSLCELAVESQADFRRSLARRCSQRGSLVLVIDSDPQGRGVRVEFVGRATGVVCYDEVSFICPAIDSFDLSTRPKFAERRTSVVFEKYIQCWKQHDVQLLESLFCEECIYQINGERVLVGIDALRDYWIYNSLRQKHVDVRYSVLSNSQNHVLVEWSANFDRVDTCDHRRLEGLMSLDLLDGRISVLREYYSQRREKK